MAASLLSSDMLVMVPSTIVVIFVNLRYAVAAQMLLGLRRYFIADTSQADQNIRRAKKVKTRKGRKSTEDETEGLLVTPFSFKEVIGTKYFGQLELMLYLIQLSVISLTFCEVFPSVFARGKDAANPLPLTFAVAALVTATIALFRVDLFGAHTSREDRLLTLAFGAGSLAAAAAVLTRKPQWSPTRQLGPAAAAIGPALQELLSGAFPAIAGRFSVPAVPEVALVIALATVSFTLALALFLPCLRFVLSFKLHRDPPDWAADQISASPSSVALMTAQFVGPLAVSMLWGRLRLRDVASLPPDEERKLQGVALLTLATIYFLNTRAVQQRYLDSALMAWYKLRNPETPETPAVEPSTTAQPVTRRSAAQAQGAVQDRPPRLLAGIVRTRINVVNGLVGRVAVETAAPAVVLVAFAVAILWSSFHADLSTDADITELIDVVVGFLAWWTCTIIFLYHGAHMWLFRAGVKA